MMLVYVENDVHNPMCSIGWVIMLVCNYDTMTCATGYIWKMDKIPIMICKDHGYRIPIESGILIILWLAYQSIWIYIFRLNSVNDTQTRMRFWKFDVPSRNVFSVNNFINNGLLHTLHNCFNESNDLLKYMITDSNGVLNEYHILFNSITMYSTNSLIDCQEILSIDNIRVYRLLDKYMGSKTKDQVHGKPDFQKEDLELKSELSPTKLRFPILRYYPNTSYFRFLASTFPIKVNLLFCIRTQLGRLSRTETRVSCIFENMGKKRTRSVLEALDEYFDNRVLSTAEVESIKYPHLIKGKHEFTNFVNNTCFDRYETLKNTGFIEEKRFDPSVSESSYVKFVQDRSWGDMFGFEEFSPEAVRIFYGNIHNIDCENLTFDTLIGSTVVHVNREMISTIINYGKEGHMVMGSEIEHDNISKLITGKKAEWKKKRMIIKDVPLYLRIFGKLAVPSLLASSRDTSQWNEDFAEMVYYLLQGKNSIDICGMIINQILKIIESLNVIGFKRNLGYPCLITKLCESVVKKSFGDKSGIKTISQSVINRMQKAQLGARISQDQVISNGDLMFHILRLGRQLECIQRQLMFVYRKDPETLEGIVAINDRFLEEEHKLESQEDSVEEISED